VEIAKTQLSECDSDDFHELQVIAKIPAVVPGCAAEAAPDGTGFVVRLRSDKANYHRLDLSVRFAYFTKT